MPKITKRDLITHCRRRDSEVCNDFAQMRKGKPMEIARQAIEAK